MADDLQQEWMSVARRLQSVAKSNGLTILAINILVNSDGKPIAWTEPKATYIEPRKNADIIAALIKDFE